MPVTRGRLIEVYSLQLGSKFGMRNIEDKKTSGYPSTWFAANPGRKPIVKVPKINLSEEEMRKAVFHGLSAGVSSDIVNAFLVSCLSKIRVESAQDWESYGIVICKAGDRITPLDLIDQEVVDVTVTDTTTSGTDPGEKASIYLCLFITSVYRLGRTTLEEEYKRKLSKLLLDHMRSLGYTGVATLDNAAQQNRSWHDSPTYKKLMAVIDMFFHRHDTHEWSILRAGTITSRHRDCAALLAYSQIVKNLGFDHVQELAEWLWVDVLGTELIRMFLREEEYDLDSSYFPYQIDLGLVGKSSYSARLNPGLHFFCNIIGCIHAQNRCHNARMILEQSTHDILSNAKLVGFVFLIRRSLNRLFLMGTLSDDTLREAQERYEAVEGQMREEAAAAIAEAEEGSDPTGDDWSSINRAEALSDEIEMPKTRSSEDWFVWYVMMDGRPNEQMYRTLGRVQSTILAPRSGTIGES